MVCWLQAAGERETILSLDSLWEVFTVMALCFTADTPEETAPEPHSNDQNLFCVISSIKYRAKCGIFFVVFCIHGIHSVGYILKQIMIY